MKRIHLQHTKHSRQMIQCKGKCAGRIEYGLFGVCVGGGWRGERWGKNLIGAKNGVEKITELRLEKTISKIYYDQLGW